MRVLIAEDEWLVAATLRRQVESHGYEVVGTVGTGAAALEKCCTQSPDLVLMDVQMPEMDGISATRALMERRPTCVVIVTGRARLEEEAEQAGAMSYVVKPLLGEQIPEMVAEAQQRFRRFMEIHADTESFEETIDTWLAVKRATLRMAQQESISEEEALARLRQTAKDRGVTLREAAEGNG